MLHRECNFRISFARLILAKTLPEWLMCTFFLWNHEVDHHSWIFKDKGLIWVKEPLVKTFSSVTNSNFQCTRYKTSTDLWRPNSILYEPFSHNLWTWKRPYWNIKDSYFKLHPWPPTTAANTVVNQTILQNFDHGKCANFGIYLPQTVCENASVWINGAQKRHHIG